MLSSGMPSVFISYRRDPADPTHESRVAGLAASLLEDGIEMFIDQNRGDEIRDWQRIECRSRRWGRCVDRIAQTRGRTEAVAQAAS